MPRRSTSKRKFALSRNLKIGVLLGGTSPEARVSMRSGRAVGDALEKCGYTVLRLNPARRDLGGLTRRDIDAAFIALHGAGGEDGTIQRFLARRRIAYTASGPEGCRLSFDKFLSKRRFERDGIPTPRYTVIESRNWESRLQRFETPFFVKPLSDGSSLGIFCVDDLQKKRLMIKRALKKYGRLLIEEKISGREFTVGVLGRRALPVIELHSSRSFYDYRAKYTRGLCRYRVPARIPETLRRHLQAAALKVHRSLELRDMSRTDMMVDGDGRIFVLEVNAIPGFTGLSLLPKAAAKAGISFEDLCDRLVRMALRRNKDRE